MTLKALDGYVLAVLPATHDIDFRTLRQTNIQAEVIEQILYGSLNDRISFLG